MLVFSRVIEEGNFSAAAHKLRLSKASVSREISALEQRLGAQLLRRTTRRMSLTEAGEVFHERCQRVVEAAQDAEFSVSQLQHAPRRAIRLAVPMSFGHLQIAPRGACFPCSANTPLWRRIFSPCTPEADTSLRRYAR